LKKQPDLNWENERVREELYQIIDWWCSIIGLLGKGGIPLITIKEMADLIGLSPTTVSNVIHGKTKEVSKETIQKINQIIKEYNYIPNMNARNLASNHSKIIGVVIRYRTNIDKNIVQDPFTGELLGAAESQIRKNRFYTMLFISDNMDEILRFTSTWNVDGLIVVGFWSEECQIINRNITKPIVFIDTYFYDDGIEYVNVGLEDEKGCYDITKYLIASGHKRIAFITDNMIGVYKARYDGYKAALQEENIEYKDGYLISLKANNMQFEQSLEDIYKRMNEFTALLCVSDNYAVRIMDYLIDRGVKIPDDISITGFDDNPIGKLVRPSLTTVRQDPTQKAIMAVDLLIKKIKGTDIEVKKVQLSTELIIRDTVKNLNERAARLC
jgi:LacI family transcriptional regulator